MRYLLGFLLVIFSTTSTVWAQSQADLERFFQGQTVTLRIDLPATREGVNIYPERAQSFNYQEYEKRIQRHGALVRGYEVVTISGVSVKGECIEVMVTGYSTPQDVARFNIHFNRIESWMLTPATVIEALKKYVEFQPETIAGAVRSRTETRVASIY
jgi:hypothetical protein